MKKIRQLLIFSFFLCSILAAQNSEFDFMHSASFKFSKGVPFIRAHIKGYHSGVEVKNVTSFKCRAQSIPPVRLKEMIQDSSLNKLLLLIEKDLQEAPRAEALRQLRDLLIIKRDFLKILRNFVTMDDFYATRKSIFQSGRLFLDGREFELCLDVNNPNAHPSLVSLSNMYLVYCDIFRTSGEKRTIIAGITAGEADGIYIGRNGIYIDDEGANWNATITRVLIQPISIREAFFSPYRWLAPWLADHRLGHRR